MIKDLFQNFEKDFLQLDDLGRFERFSDFFTEISAIPKAQWLPFLLSLNSPMKITFVRFLKDIPAQRAMDWLLIFIGDENPIVKDNAIAAFRENGFGEKYYALRSALSDPLVGTVLFSIQTLARLNDFYVLPKLLSMLPNSTKEVQIEILRALRFLPDIRSTQSVMEFVNEKDEKLRYHAVVTLGMLLTKSGSVSSALFVRCLEDPSQKIRQAALNALENNPSKAVAQFFIEKATNGKTIEERVRALRGLAAFQTDAMVPLLVRVLLNDPEPRIRFAAENSLRNFSPDILLKPLLTLMSDSDIEIRGKSALLSAEILNENEEIRKKIFTLWDEASKPPEKVMMLRVLKELGGSDTLEKLLKELNGPPILVYSVVETLCQISEFSSRKEILMILNESRFNSILKQTVLNAIQRRGPALNIREDLLKWIESALLDPVDNIRYFCVQILNWYEPQEFIPHLISQLLREKEATIYETTLQTILKAIGKRPGPLLSAFGMHPEITKLLPHLLLILEKGSWSPEAVKAISEALQKEPFNAMTLQPEAYLKLASQWIKKSLIEPHQVWKNLSSPNLRSRFLTILKESLQASPTGTSSFSLAFAQSALGEWGDRERQVIFDISNLINQPDSIPVLVEILLDTQDEACFKEGKRSLNKLVWGSPS